MTGDIVVEVAAWGFGLVLLAHVVQALVDHQRRRLNKTPRTVLGILVTLCAPFVVLCCGVTTNPALRRTRWGMAVQTLLVALAGWWAIRHGVFSRQLVSPVYLGLGLLAGHIVFVLSLLATQSSWKEASSHFVDFGALWEFAVENPNVLMQYAIVSVGEEIIYRVAAQPLFIEWLHSPLLGILVVAALFSCVHEHFFNNSFWQSLEFFGFALLLGGLYYWTGSLILVIVIHAVRNTEIAFIEDQIHRDDAGQERADRETELINGSRVLVMLVAPGPATPVACLEHTEKGWSPFHAPQDATA